MQKNQQASAIALRRTLGKSKKIVDLGITPTMTVDEKDALIRKLTDQKLAKDPSLDRKDVMNGQDWFVNELIEFSALKPQERLDKEYAQAFPEVADDNEGLAAVEAFFGQQADQVAAVTQ